MSETPFVNATVHPWITQMQRNTDDTSSHGWLNRLSSSLDPFNGSLAIFLSAETKLTNTISWVFILLFNVYMCVCVCLHVVFNVIVDSTSFYQVWHQLIRFWPESLGPWLVHRKLESLGHDSCWRPGLQTHTRTREHTCKHISTHKRSPYQTPTRILMTRKNKQACQLPA